MFRKLMKSKISKIYHQSGGQNILTSPSSQKNIRCSGLPVCAERIYGQSSQEPESPDGIREEAPDGVSRGDIYGAHAMIRTFTQLKTKVRNLFGGTGDLTAVELSKTKTVTKMATLTRLNKVN